MGLRPGEQPLSGRAGHWSGGMNSALFGLVSAAGLGTADFMARFSAREVGAPLALGAVLVVGALVSTSVLVLSGSHLSWSGPGVALAIVHGVSVAIMCILLYAGLARGPVAIVAPIVAAHPALVLIVYVVLGTRPSFVQWLAMSSVVIGGVLIARAAHEHPQFAVSGRGEMTKTLLIAFGACLAYVILVITGQAAAPLIGELQTVCIGRWSGLIFVGLILAATRTSPSIPRAWLPFLFIQGSLDTIGYLAFMAGARAEAPHVAMVVASAFSVFTVLLARIVLAEQISPRQWGAIGLIAGGTAILAGAE